MTERTACQHGIRHPWACNECDAAAWEIKQASAMTPPQPVRTPIRKLSPCHEREQQAWRESKTPDELARMNAEWADDFSQPWSE